MGDVSLEMIHKTQKSLGKYVKKPVLTDKLLKKPPFRFLHDIVKVIIKENGFLQGLFSEEELNSENVKEKEAKVAFLTKLIDATKTLSKTDLKAKPNKIVAGLEPADTNALLQTIAKILDSKQDTQDYVTQIKSVGVKNGNKSHNKKDLVKKTTSKDSLNKLEGKNNDAKKEKSRENVREKPKIRDSSVTRVKKSSSLETPKSSERQRDSSRTRSRKTDEKIPEKSNRQKVKSRDKESKSKEKIIEEVRIRENETENENGELKIADEPINIQQNDELNNKNNLENNNGSVKLFEADDADQKTADENNEKMFENNGKSSENIEKPSGNHGEHAKKPESAVRHPSAGLVRPKSARPKSGGGDRERSIPSRMGKSDLKDVADGAEKQGLVEMKVTAPSSTRPRSSLLRPPSVRPSSARPGAPRLRSDAALPVSEPVVMGNINVIVENFDLSGGDEEETVVIQNTSEMVDDEGPTAKELLNMSTENKGQLVEQILEQIQEAGDGDSVKKKVDIDWEQEGLRGKDATTKEVTQLRALIQNLTKTANPLGKLMNYLHEDLDAMHSELQMWTNTKRQLYIEIEKQKQINAETSKPLLAKLERLKTDVKKIEEEISTSRSNILKNDKRIAEFLNKKRNNNYSR